ncbi:MAG: hypothetical protein NZO16_03945 [Deltaproteobacteria bacterium]|nr:hypothetical protein [Deltaproteobacteria bacterium]
MKKLIERWYLVAPLVIFPAGQNFGVAFPEVLKTFLLILIGLILIDIALEVLIQSLRKVVRVWHLTTFVAFSTNLPEFGVALTSCLKGDPLNVAPGVALGSNTVNVIFGFCALFLALLVLCILGGVVETVKRYDYKRGAKQLLLALFFALAAVSYYRTLHSSELIAVWMVFVIIIIGFFVFLNFKQSHGKKISLLSQIPHQELDRALESCSVTNPLIDFLKFVDRILHEPEHHTLNEILRSEELLILRKASKQSFKNWIAHLPQESHQQIEEILEHFDIYTHLAKSKSLYILYSFISLAIIGAGAFCLDMAGDQLATNFQLSKGIVSFFILSFLTSAGEFLTTYKFFLQGKFRDGWRNIADSNLANLIIAGFIVILHFAIF